MDCFGARVRATSDSVVGDSRRGFFLLTKIILRVMMYYVKGGRVMKKATKVWLVISTALIVIGAVLFVAVMTKYNWDFTKLSTAKYETNTYEIKENFSHISINTDSADITFAPSSDGKCKVNCYEETKAKHLVKASHDTLHIELVNEKEWYDYISINFTSPKITIYLPKTEYNSLEICEDTGDIEIPNDFKLNDVDISLSTGDVNFSATASGLVKIKTSTGDISLKKATADKLNLSTSTGNIAVVNTNCLGYADFSVTTGKTTLTDFKCKNLNSSGDTGDLFLIDVIVSQELSVIRDTGDIKFDASDANEIFIETDTGDVKGTLLTDKVFITETDTGSVNVPKTVSGGKCEIKTDTGNIKIAIK